MERRLRQCERQIPTRSNVANDAPAKYLKWVDVEKDFWPSEKAKVLPGDRSECPDTPSAEVRCAVCIRPGFVFCGHGELCVSLSVFGQFVMGDLFEFAYHCGIQRQF